MKNKLYSGKMAGIFILLVFMLFATCTGGEKSETPQPHVIQQKYIVVIPPFDQIDGLDKEEADGIHNFFASEIARAWGIEVVSHNDSEKVMDANCIIQSLVSASGEEITITTRVLDANTGEIFSVHPLQLSNRNEMAESIPLYAADIVRNLPGVQGNYEIGSLGPGGGIIFYAYYGYYMECSEDLGEITWYEAEAAAKNYRGGGFTDWRLPSLRELDFVYKNLKKNNLGTLYDEWYWSTNTGITINHMWDIHFSDGSHYNQFYKGDTNRAIAIRAFNLYE